MFLSVSVEERCCNDCFHILCSEGAICDWALDDWHLDFCGSSLIIDKHLQLFSCLYYEMISGAVTDKRDKCN